MDTIRTKSSYRKEQKQDLVFSKYLGFKVPVEELSWLPKPDLLTNLKRPETNRNRAQDRINKYGQIEGTCGSCANNCGYAGKDLGGEQIKCKRKDMVNVWVGGDYLDNMNPTKGRELLLDQNAVMWKEGYSEDGYYTVYPLEDVAGIDDADCPGWQAMKVVEERKEVI